MINIILLIAAIIISVFKIQPHWSILAGIIITTVIPKKSETQGKIKSLSSNLLQASIILMGAGLNFQSILSTGSKGVVTTATSIILIFLIGTLFSRLFKIESPLSELLCAGTAICGGSAISALSPILKASSITMATALGIVFILNATAVFIFPPIGHYLHLGQEQFGTWAALAIHDTSSVVAASQIYGDEALKIGTTLKLTRALWIIPLSLLFAISKKSGAKINVPWFIGLFLLVSLVFTFLPEISFLIAPTSYLSKTGLSLTLFLVGLSLNKEQILSIGPRPILFGITLWLLTSLGSLLYVLQLN